MNNLIYYNYHPIFKYVIFAFILYVLLIMNKSKNVYLTTIIIVCIFIILDNIFIKGNDDLINNISTFSQKDIDNNILLNEMYTDVEILNKL